MGNFTWNNIKDWVDGELVFSSDLDAYISNNIGFIFEEFPPNFFGADKAIFPSSDFASVAQFETTTTDAYSPNWTEITFSGSADQAAQWNFRSWFTDADLTGFRFRAYATDATAATDDVDIEVSISAISDGDTDTSVNTKAFVSWGTVVIDAATLEDTAFTTKTYSIPATTDWDTIAVGDQGVVQLKRLGAADELPLDLKVTRAWFY